MASMPAHVRAPMTAKVLGWLGLVPFVAGAAVFSGGPPRLAGPALLALLTYSAAVLSFLGGIRWGVDITRPEPRWRELCVSALPPVVAWALLALPLSAPSQLGGFILAFLFQWLGDAHAPEEAPVWYRRMRTPLTLGATVALAVALEKAIEA